MSSWAPAIRGQPDALLWSRCIWRAFGASARRVGTPIDRLDLSARHVSDFLPDELGATKAQVVVFPYRDSNLSSSAAVSGHKRALQCAITPVNVFADIAAGCFVLQVESSDLAEVCLIRREAI